MTWKHLLGASLVALPFIFVLAIVAQERGWTEALTSFAVAAVIFLVMMVGTYLLAVK